MQNKKKTIAFYTLGCKVNQYETQMLCERLAARGFDIVTPEEVADIYIINSCTVTGMADKKSRNYARRSKRLNPNAVTALVGCYAETAAENLAQIPEIDLIVGSADKDKLPEIIFDKYGGPVDPSNHMDSQASLLAELSQNDNIQSVSGLGGRTRAYMKIEDGCDRYCAFCIVPYARGAVRSRAIDEIVAEARTLVKNGYKELILTGVNAALYGSDFSLADEHVDGSDRLSSYSHTNRGGQPPAPALALALAHTHELPCMQDNRMDSSLTPMSGIINAIDAVSEIDGEFRIRLSSLEPTVINADYARELVKRERLCPHFHLSLQSGSDKILSAMGRRYNMDDYLRIVDVLKTHDENFSITTDLIVGFPGETDDDFKKTLTAVEKVGFSKIHVFKYSRREGTRAAEMNGQIPEHVKNERSRALVEAGEAAAEKFVDNNVGDIRQTLFFGLAKEVGLNDGADADEQSVIGVLAGCGEGMADGTTYADAQCGAGNIATNATCALERSVLAGCGDDMVTDTTYAGARCSTDDMAISDTPNASGAAEQDKHSVPYYTGITDNDITVRVCAGSDITATLRNVRI